MADNQVTVITPEYVTVNITNSSQRDCCSIEKRYQKGITIADLKGKLELVTGGSPATMEIELYSKENVLIGKLDNNDALLGSYPVDDGMRFHVVDTFALRNEFEDVSKVEKFELSLEDYSKRTDTLRSFLERNKLGKFNEEEMKRREEEKKKEEEADEAAARAATVGDRCEVRVPGQPIRRATVMYIGNVDFKQGLWIGVKYDEPLGKNDGTANGKRYFECSPKYGGFIKPTYVAIGDYPEETFDLDEEI